VSSQVLASGLLDGRVGATLARHGRVDVLFDNAGGQHLMGARDHAEGHSHCDASQRRERLGDDAQRHDERDAPAGGGEVINVMLSPHTGLPGIAHSTASRAAVASLTRVLAIEWARFGIAINPLAAGHCATETFMTKYPHSVVEEAARTVPLQRPGRHAERART
jgi:citronellol/citronellal dehydrogenase